jgi:hypothetical protein
LISVWFSENKVKIMTRSGTQLDVNPSVWGEILASVAHNIAHSREQSTGSAPTETLSAIKDSLDASWRLER